MQLEQALINLRPAIVKCWQQIGFDVLESVESCGDSIDNFTAVEACIDADSLLLVCNNKPAWELAKTIIREHGYDRVLKFLDQHIQLV